MNKHFIFCYASYDNDSLYLFTESFVYYSRQQAVDYMERRKLEIIEELKEAGYEHVVPVESAPELWRVITYDGRFAYTLRIEETF